MLKWLEGIYQGAVGRFLRASLATVAGLAASHYGKNEWYLAATPLLQAIGKWLRMKYPDSWNWLPF